MATVTASEKAWASGDEEGWARKSGSERRAAAQVARDYAASDAGRLMATYSRIEDLQTSGPLTDAEQAELGGLLEAERARRSAAERQAAAAVQESWTREVTIARRAAWNASVRASKARAVTPALIAALESAAGHTYGDLKRAIQHYGL